MSETTTQGVDAELEAATAILGEPTCAPALAIVHLGRAWRGLAALAGAVDPDEPAAQSALVGLTRASARRREALLAEHAAILASARGDAPPPGRRILLRHVAALRQIYRALRTPPPIRTRAITGLRWAARITLWGGLVFALFAAIARPWQSPGFGPWRVVYYPTAKLTGDPIVRYVPHLSFFWGDEAPLDEVPADDFSARFDTCLLLEEDLIVTFQLTHNDGARLYVDGRKIIDNWKTGRWGYTRRIPVEGGWHHLRVDYFEAAGDAEVHLLASFDESEPPETIATSYLRRPVGELSARNPCAGL
ncbi:MAG: hypothetical protein H6711_15340 [Myxococcales bacterium]|nr:hypothetical protein [Myxococcales bacterium]